MQIRYDTTLSGYRKPEDARSVWRRVTLNAEGSEMPRKGKGMERSSACTTAGRAVRITGERKGIS